MRHFINRLTIGITVCLFLLVTINGVFAGEEKAAAEGDIALVNGKPIDKMAYDREMKKVNMRYEKTGRKLSDEEMQKIETAVIDDLITREVLYQESEKKGIEVDPKEVDKQYDMIVKRYPDKKKFKELLAQWNFTEDEIKSEIKRRTAVQELIKNNVTDKIEIPDTEVKKYYDDNPEKFKASEEVKASHILIKFDPSKADDAKKESAKKQLEDVKKRIGKGEDFAALAKEISEGPSKKNGGDLGFIRKGQMVKPFEDAAFALEAGEVSDIVETRFGYHLIKVFEKKPEKKIEYKEVKDRLANQLKQQKAQEEAMTYIQKLKDSAKIEKKNTAQKE
jgi:peptidyl-prolyl cis-trans isomerase C